ncbi:hypothetical protein D9757_010364 [Collybiopsis confluens]|uniref:Uncharacterized protein n=1 Tax=Collybiopsis confluens TaxID=2823264 RepID=A0A8H5GV90_9AGAR|nr:hypothetical protein D9757_010364 [Collybiopsis confluens]
MANTFCVLFARGYLRCHISSSEADGLGFAPLFIHRPVLLYPGSMNVSSSVCLLFADAGNASSTNSSPSCDPDSTRTALGILWSCLSVLFACTWVSVHPNVPGPNEGFARRLWTKMTLMMVALIAPELLVMWAVRQWYAARELTKCVYVLGGKNVVTESFEFDYKGYEFDYQGYKGWTKTHAFFALMGGFSLYKGNKHVSVLRFIPSEQWSSRRKMLDDFNKSSISGSNPVSGYAAIPPISDVAMAEADFNDRSFAAHATFIRRVPVKELEDRNKSDSFAKLIAVGQTIWFVVQLCARWATNLPITELEVMTLAFAAMNVPIYFFWWNKPLGVGVPIRIQKNAQTIKEGTDDQPATDGHARLLTRTGIRDACSLLSQRVMKDLKDFGIGRFFEHTGLFGKILIGLPLWLLLIPTFAIIKAILQEGMDIDDGPAEKVESFERTGDLEPKNAADKLVAYGAAMIFGAIHCIAWTSHFPSEQEKILWRVCSPLVACIPISLALFNVLSSRLGSADLGSRWLNILFRSLLVIALSLYLIAVLMYIFARLSLLVQGFLALRALPPAALEAVQWTNFLPHI